MKITVAKRGWIWVNRLMVSSNEFITVVVPVFNEGVRIIDNLDLLISEIEGHFSRFEILVVSDGSTDETNYRVFQFKYPGLRLLMTDRNLGKGAAIRKGFSEAKGDYIFFIDGGMELHPKELRIFFGLMKLYEADIVIASKRHPQSKIFYPWYRKILSAGFQIVVKKLFGVNVTDTQVGMKLFRRDVIMAILPMLKVDRYGFDLEILSLASMMGYNNVLEAPVQLDYFSKNDRTTVGDLLHVLRVGVSLLKDTYRLYRRIRALRREVVAAREVA